MLIRSKKKKTQNNTDNNNNKNVIAANHLSEKRLRLYDYAFLEY